MICVYSVYGYFVINRLDFVRKVNHPLCLNIAVGHFLASVSSILLWEGLLELELISIH